jgi:hypothetical protein
LGGGRCVPEGQYITGGKGIALLTPQDLDEIRERRNRKAVLIVYCTYGDESRDPSKKRVYAVAGAFAHQDEWDKLELEWSARLGGLTFHASDCECDKGDFGKFTHTENQTLYRDLVGIIGRHKVNGHGVAINVADYSSCFPYDEEHAPYVWGFGDVIQISSELAYLSIPSGEVKITFDNNQELQFSASEMYRYLLESKRLKTRGNLFGEVAFACRRTVGIQVADLIARETMKHLDNKIGPVYRAVRLSMSALMKNDKVRFFHLDKSHFQDAVNNFPASMESVSTRAAYSQWLRAKGLQDCLTSQLMHIRELGPLWDNIGQ